MTQHSTDTDVVRTVEEAALLAHPPLLVLDNLQRFLDQRGLGDGELVVRRIGEGQSNLTYLLERGPSSFVLRRGPRPPYPPSAHDMLREANLLTAVHDVGIPVPRIVGVCADPDVVGVPFYVMDFVDGLILTHEVPAALSTVAQRRATVFAAVDTLAALHAVDASVPPLADLGRPTGYLNRQVSRFTDVWDRVTTRSVPLVQELARRLADGAPTTQRTTLVHGDYRLGNIMFDRDAPNGVVAVMDWELSTLGDPIADLGYLLATYSVPTSPALAIELTPATREPGFPSRAELVERYAVSSDLDLGDLEWYQALALWKSSIFCEAIYTRWLQGERAGDTFAPCLEEGVPEMLAEAKRFLDMSS